MLAAGIDVFSTVNVQHLESLNDQVAELTGVRVRETFPDSVLSRRRRGRAGRRHPAGADRAPAGGQDLQARARPGRAQRLLPRREPRGAARDRAAPGGRGRRGQAARARAAAGARRGPRDRRRRRRRRSASGCSRSSRRRPSSQRVVRRAWRSAQRLGAELDILTVLAPGREPDAAEAEQLDALRRLGSLLGAQVLVEEGDDVAEVVARVAARARHHLRADRHARGRATACERLAEPLTERLLRAAPGRRPADRRRPLQARLEPPMSAWDVLPSPLIALAAGVAVTAVALRRAPRPRRAPRRRGPKILFPFVGTRAVRARAAGDAAARAGRARDVVPAYLATVPLPLALDAPFGRACDEAFSVFEAIEQRAARVGVPVDARIARGRNVRHALRQLMAEVPAHDRDRRRRSEQRRARRIQRRRHRLAAAQRARRGASSSGPTRWRASDCRTRARPLLAARPADYAHHVGPLVETGNEADHDRGAPSTATGSGPPSPRTSPRWPRPAGDGGGIAWIGLYRPTREEFAERRARVRPARARRRGRGQRAPARRSSSATATRCSASCARRATSTRPRRSSSARCTSSPGRTS